MRLAKLTAMTVSLRVPWRSGSALKLGRFTIVNSAAKSASSDASGRRSRWRMKSECQASSVTTRTGRRWAGSAPPNSSWTKSSLPDMCALKSAHSASKWAGVIEALKSHHTVFSVASSRTVNLSRAERPVCCPVSTTSAPPLATRPSPRRTASSYSASSRQLKLSFIASSTPRSLRSRAVIIPSAMASPRYTVCRIVAGGRGLFPPQSAFQGDRSSSRRGPNHPKIHAAARHCAGRRRLSWSARPWCAAAGRDRDRRAGGYVHPRPEGARTPRR